MSTVGHAGVTPVVNSALVMPRYAVDNLSLAPSKNESVHNHGIQAFWDKVDAYGAYTSDPFIADTYKTICDIGGQGVLTNVICPGDTGHGLPGGDVTIRITRDGSVETVVLTEFFGFRAVLGAVYEAESANVPPLDANNGFFSGYPELLATFQQYRSDFPRLMPPQYVLQLGGPYLTFTSSLRVEIKHEIGCATAIQRNAGVLYVGA